MTCASARGLDWNQEQGGVYSTIPHPHFGFPDFNPRRPSRLTGAQRRSWRLRAGRGLKSGNQGMLQIPTNDTGACKLEPGPKERLSNIALGQARSLEGVVSMLVGDEDFVLSPESMVGGLRSRPSENTLIPSLSI